MSSGSEYEEEIEESDSSYQGSSDGTQSSGDDSDSSAGDEIISIEDDVVPEKVTAWIQQDECGKCLEGKAAALEKFMLSR
jgi:hypothetical protein